MSRYVRIKTWKEMGLTERPEHWNPDGDMDNLQGCICERKFHLIYYAPNKRDCWRFTDDEVEQVEVLFSGKASEIFEQLEVGMTCAVYGALVMGNCKEPNFTAKIDSIVGSVSNPYYGQVVFDNHYILNCMTEDSNTIITVLKEKTMEEKVTLSEQVRKLEEELKVLKEKLAEEEVIVPKAEYFSIEDTGDSEYPVRIDIKDFSNAPSSNTPWEAFSVGKDWKVELISGIKDPVIKTDSEGRLIIKD